MDGAFVARGFSFWLEGWSMANGSAGICSRFWPGLAPGTIK